MNVQPVGNTYVGSLYSKGYSSLKMSFYYSKLIFDFAPWIGVDNTGRSLYDYTSRLSTSANLEGAAYFYLVAVSILRGEDSKEQVEATLPCKGDASLILSYRPDENNNMSAYLVINKDQQTIPFKFNSMQKRAMVNGQMMTKTVQSELGALAMMLFGYIIENGGEEYLKRVFEEGLNP